MESEWGVAGSNSSSWAENKAIFAAGWGQGSVSGAAAVMVHWANPQPLLPHFFFLPFLHLSHLRQWLCITGTATRRNGFESGLQPLDFLLHPRSLEGKGRVTLCFSPPETPKPRQPFSPNGSHQTLLICETQLISACIYCCRRASWPRSIINPVRPLQVLDSSCMRRCQLPASVRTRQT